VLSPVLSSLRTHARTHSDATRKKRIRKRASYIANHNVYNVLSLHSINVLDFLKIWDCVLCEVRTESLAIILKKSDFKDLMLLNF
jgi:hypothetical protein